MPAINNQQGNWWASTGSGTQYWDPSINSYVDSNSQRGRQLAAKGGAGASALDAIVAGERASQLAEVDTQETADTMALNREASRNSLALAQSMGRRRQVGGGNFQARGQNLNSAIAGLSSANARAIGNKRRAQVNTSLGTPTGRMAAAGNYTQQVKRAIGG